MVNVTRQLFQKTDVPPGCCGEFAVERYTIVQEQADIHMVRCLLKGFPQRAATPGVYTRLVRTGGTWDRKIVMSDTPAEIRDLYEPVLRARGHCLVNGLGLGIVTEAMLRKDEVESVIVVESSADVIRLVGDYLQDKWSGRLHIEHADAFTYRPPRSLRFGVVWHDIWDALCADNVPEMKKLHRRYGHKADWQGSWSRAEVDANWRDR